MGIIGRLYLSDELIVARIDELEEIENKSESDKQELDNLIRLDVLGSNNNVDWGYGVQVIREDCFYEYIVEKIESDFAGNEILTHDHIVIDWDKTVKNARNDYASIEVDGYDYLIEVLY